MALVLVGCDDDDASRRDAAAPSTSAPPGTTTTPSGPASFPDQDCCFAEEVEAGTYVLPDWLAAGLTVEVDGSLGVINEERAGYFVLGEGDNGTTSPSRALTLLAVPAGPSGDEVIDRFVTGVDTTRPVGTLHVRGRPESTATGRLDAIEVTADAEPDPTNEGNPSADIAAGVADLRGLEGFVAPGFQMTTLTAGERLRLTAIETDGQVLLAVTEAPPSEFAAFRDRVDQILASLMPL